MGGPGYHGNGLMGERVEGTPVGDQVSVGLVKEVY